MTDINALIDECRKWAAYQTQHAPDLTAGTLYAKAAAALREQQQEIARLQTQKARLVQAGTRVRYGCVCTFDDADDEIILWCDAHRPWKDRAERAEAERDAALKKAEQCQCIYVCRRGISSNSSTI